MMLGNGSKKLYGSTKESEQKHYNGKLSMIKSIKQQHSLKSEANSNI